MPNEGPPATDDGKTGLGLDTEVQGVLAYAFFWLSGALLFVLEKKDPEARFHAAQSLLVFLPVQILWVAAILLNWLLRPPEAVGCVIWTAIALFMAAGLALWAFLMLRAWTNRPWKVPLLGDLALSMSRVGEPKPGP